MEVAVSANEHSHVWYSRQTQAAEVFEKEGFQRKNVTSCLIAFVFHAVAASTHKMSRNKATSVFTGQQIAGYLIYLNTSCLVSRKQAKVETSALRTEFVAM